MSKLTLSPFERGQFLTSIARLIKEAYGNSRDHGFWDDYTSTLRAIELGTVRESSHEAQLKYILDVKLSKIALMHSELGEMTEGVRKPHQDEHCPEFTSEEVELADTLIRAFDYAEAFGLRLEEAILAKMEVNAGRPYKHGKGA